MCSDGYRQPIFTPVDKQVGTHPGWEGRKGEIVATTLGSRVEGTTNLAAK